MTSTLNTKTCYTKRCGVVFCFMMFSPNLFEIQLIQAHLVPQFSAVISLSDLFLALIISKDHHIFVLSEHAVFFVWIQAFRANLWIILEPLWMLIAEAWNPHSARQTKDGSEFTFWKVSLFPFAYALVLISFQIMVISGACSAPFTH